MLCFLRHQIHLDYQPIQISIWYQHASTDDAHFHDLLYSSECWKSCTKWYQSKRLSNSSSATCCFGGWTTVILSIKQKHKTLDKVLLKYLICYLGWYRTDTGPILDINISRTSRTQSLGYCCKMSSGILLLTVATISNYDSLALHKN